MPVMESICKRSATVHQHRVSTSSIAATDLVAAECAKHNGNCCLGNSYIVHSSCYALVINHLLAYQLQLLCSMCSSTVHGSGTTLQQKAFEIRRGARSITAVIAAAKLLHHITYLYDTLLAAPLYDAV
eukprot:11053-Heterococcus_DN1.PRE.4